MSALRNPPRGRFARGRGAGDIDPGLRVSDAERAQVADMLAKHYSDGRLDHDTFNERLDKAMRATTQSDLAGLLTDLPGTGAPPGALPQGSPAGRPRRGRGQRILFLVLIVVIAAAVGHAVAGAVIPWLVLGLLAVVWMRYGPRRRRRL